MIKDGKYRFTLQFGAETMEERRAGDFLEQLGNRKSPIVIAALNEYIEQHPELLTQNAHILLHLSGPTQEQLEETIRQIIEERLRAGLPLQAPVPTVPVDPAGPVDDDILDMLNDLDCFR